MAMRLEALKFIRCPACKGPLRLTAKRAVRGEVLDGYLSCLGCGLKFGIHNGLPSLLAPGCLRAANWLSRLLYDVYAPFYDRLEARLARSLGFSEGELREEIASYLDLSGHESVLEVCVGTGGNLPYIRARTDGLVAGLDISREMLRVCQAKARELGLDAHLFMGCAERLPFKDGFFDRVLIGGGISYFSDPRAALAEARRVASDGGLVIVFEQVTALERLLKRELMPLRYLPKGLKPIGLKWLFKRRFYLLKLACQ